MTRLRAYVVSLFSFREANHTAMVKALENLPKYPAPKRTHNAKVRSFAEWSARYDYRRRA